MNEVGWMVVIAISVLIGIVGALVKLVGMPIIDLTKQLTIANMNAKANKEANEKTEKENKEDHKILFKAQREDERKILEHSIGHEDHEKRITNLEAERKIKVSFENGV